MLGFYLDHHVPSAIARGLERRGISILTALQDNAGSWSDEAILQRATELDRVVFTQDDDFLVLAHSWQQSGREFAGVIYAHQLRITIGGAIRDLELVAQVLSSDEMRNRIEFLPL
ncbi:MAG: DUF5615 family PIN-like protein [Planctomycetales bacterium]|nr:DUF5615 family PIN-like protein [Planctomycetales bacterium]